MSISLLDTSMTDFEEKFAPLLARDAAVGGAVFASVTEILNAVRQEGDAALLRYTEKFDHVAESQVQHLAVQPACRQEALARIDPELRQALEQAAERIRQYHEHQLHADWSFQDAHGTTLAQRYTAIDRVGLYVPGGLASYPSSVLMNAIPAKVAGVKELVMVVPAPSGQLSDLVLAAAEIVGIDEIYKVGGAQAIGALAYGTQTIPAVDKIVGPGNQYVATAKRLVFGKVGIDMVAGPSEVLIIADEQANPEWVAWDLIAQAEHDAMAQSILLSTSQQLIEKVKGCLAEIVPQQPRAEIIQKSLDDYGVLVKVKDAQEAIDLANRIAAEHVELMVEQPDAWLSEIRHAGSILVGAWSAVSMGDYSLGSNHVLPTVGGARFSSPLGVDDFRKRTSIVSCTPAGAKQCGLIARQLARGESLEAHARSAECRIDAADAQLN